MWKTLLILAAVLYSLSPIDFLPDYIFGWGWLDDAAVLFILWQVFVRLKQRLDTIQGSRTQKNGRSGQTRENDAHQKSTSKSTLKPPHEILGVSPHATLDEIKHAYRQLAAQYHPDKVSHLGDEFRQLAEMRFKEIQEAYQELVSKKKR